MMNDDNKDQLSNTKKDDDLEIKIDKIPSLWNQLRLAWEDFLNAKKNSKDTKQYEVRITHLLKELDISLDEKNPKEIFEVTVEKDDKILDLVYKYGSQHETS